MCHSITLCQSCQKCQKCCAQSSCRSQAPEILANLVTSRCRSKSGSNPKGGLHPTLPKPAKTSKTSHSRKLLCQSSQEQLPVRGITSAYGQKCHRTGKTQNIPELFQPTLPSPQTGQQVAAHTGPQQSEPISQGREIQNGNSGNYPDLPPTRGVGDLNRFQGCLLPYTNTRAIQEIPEISCPGANISIQSTAFRSVNSPPGVHGCSKGGKTNGHTHGYKNPPVPRRLVGQSHIPPGLLSTYSGSGSFMSKSRLVGEPGQVGTGTETSLRLRRLSIRPQDRSGPTDTGLVAKPSGEDFRDFVTTGLSGPAIHVPDRPANGHRKTGSSRPTTYETHTMASQKQLENTGVSREDHSSTQVPAPPFTVVDDRKERATRPTITPSKTCSADLYRRIKRRVGRSLKRTHGKRFLVSTRKQTSHKLSGTQSSFSGLKRVPRSLHRQHSSDSNRQYNRSGLHKQGRRHEVGSIMCPTLENLDLVLPTSSDSKSPTYSRPVKRNSGQAVQTGSDHPDRVVPPSGSFSQAVQQMAPASGRPLCDEVQPQTTSICITSAGQAGHSGRCTHSALGGSGCLCLSTNCHFGQSSRETTGFSLQKTHFDCSGVAQHALVLGPGDHVQSSPAQSTQSAQPVDSTLQSDPSQKSGKFEPPCMAPRASTIKEQGFSAAVAARIEAPQRRSTRSIYEAKWAVFTKWCVTNKVDFRSPPVTAIANFLLYLFEDKKLQPNTIDGYRSAIADKLGSAIVNVSKDDNLTRLLDSFHRDRPKGRRGIPSWNLSLVLHQLTKAPFEPLKEASLKHLTFKTVFLLALGSGKRRSEIYAWQHKNIRHQSDWSKVSLYPSPSFLSKNQLAREGPESIAPVVIPALAPTLDRSLKADKSLCPVRALRYYLDRTSDLRQNKELVFVSFKKSFDKDISPATISSWIKQAVILCYELSDHQAHTLHQVKAHDVRAFAASKAFQSGVSLEQILAACHWKSHNTFTQFYLKDLAWADSELFHLGPMVAAQQIHQQSKG